MGLLEKNHPTVVDAKSPQEDVQKLPFPIPELEALIPTDPDEERQSFAVRLYEIGRVLHNFMTPHDANGVPVLDPRVTEERDMFGADTVYKISGIVPGSENGQTREKFFVESTPDSFTIRKFVEDVETETKTSGETFDLKFDYTGKEDDLVVRVAGYAPGYSELVQTIHPVRRPASANKNFENQFATVKRVLPSGIKAVTAYLKDTNRQSQNA